MAFSDHLNGCSHVASVSEIIVGADAIRLVGFAPQFDGADGLSISPTKSWQLWQRRIADSLDRHDPGVVQVDFALAIVNGQAHRGMVRFATRS